MKIRKAATFLVDLDVRNRGLWSGRLTAEWPKPVLSAARPAPESAGGQMRYLLQWAQPRHAVRQTAVVIHQPCMRGIHTNLAETGRVRCLARLAGQGKRRRGWCLAVGVDSSGKDKKGVTEIRGIPEGRRAWHSRGQAG